MAPGTNARRTVRWSTYVLLVACFVVGFFHRFAPATFAGSLSIALGTSAATLGLLSSLHYWVYTAMQIPAGMLVDRWGTRICVAAGSLLTGGGSVLLATSHTLAVACLGPALTGLGLSAVFIGLMKSNATWFPASRYGLMTGLTMLLGNVGSVAAGSPSAALLHVLSWREIFVVAGAVPVVLAVAVLLVCRNRPQDVGTGLRTVVSGRGPQGRTRPLRDLRATLTAGRMWPIFWCTIGTNGTFYAFSSLWGVPMLTDGFHLSNQTASWYTTAALMVYGLVSFAVGFVSDRLGRRRPFVVGASAAALAGWVLLAAAPWRPGWSGVLLYLLVGAAAGQVTVSFSALKESVDLRLSATALSVVNCGVFGVSAILQPVMGTVLDALAGHGARPDLHDYRLALLLPAAFALAGLVWSLRVRETGCEQLGTDPAPPVRAAAADPAREGN